MRRMQAATAVMVCAAAVTMATSAQAQQRRPVAPRPAAPRMVGITITLDGIYQSASSSLADSGSSTINLERSTYSSSLKLKGGPAADLAVGYRLHRQLSIVVGGSSFTRASSAAITAQIPHPFFFNQPRTVSGSQDLKHQESAIRVDIAWTAPVSRKLDLTVSAGPTMFKVKQDVVSTVNYKETFPFDTADFAGVTTVRRSKSVTGFNAGVDMTYRLTRNFGVGGTVRVSRASTSIASVSGSSLDLSVGGAQVGGGIRIRF
jgi:hypothetical protein